ncbi:MAG TPA: acetylxylan esterase, partial [Bryobacteraceae bacterium]|nr:acetylxylan esterase [Bryobacteraceae bacterium]
ARAGAQRGLPPVTPYRDYSRCLPDFLRELAAQAYARRNRELAKLATAARIRERQVWARETFWKLAGGMPERTPLNARTTGGFERAGYRVEKLVYESQPGLIVSANLYIPAGNPPFPGILFQMGHSANGKAYGSYQRCCQGLVKLGFLVLAFDPMGQGERIYYPAADGTRSRLPSADSEHTVPGRQMLLYGDTSTRLQLWDAIRSLDYLAAHPLVDPARLGSTGQSGGATLTMLLACVDDRLAAAAVMSGNTENVACADFNPPGSTDDAEQDFVASGPLGFDRWDTLYPFAPKPLLVSVSAHDFFGTYSPSYIANGREEFAKLRAVYERLGHTERIEWTDTPLPHSLAYDSRLRVYNWFTRWLKKDAQPVAEEPPVAPEPDSVLLVSDSGSVVRSLGSLTPFELNRRRKVNRNTSPDLARLFGVDRPSAAARFTVLGKVPSRDAEIESVEVASAPGVQVPAWLFMPRSKAQTGAVYILLGPGRRSQWHEGELYLSLAAAGHVVLAPDMRGNGDLAPEVGRGASAYTRDHSDEENYAWSSLILGKPLAGQWITDVLALAAALRARPETQGRRLILAARGKFTVAALVAAALDRSIETVYLSEGLLSFADVAETENYEVPFANFVPNLLRETDLPEIAASVAPRKVVLAGPVTAAGSPADAASARRLYSAARVEPAPGFDKEQLTSL